MGFKLSEQVITKIFEDFKEIASFKKYILNEDIEELVIKYNE